MRALVAISTLVIALGCAMTRSGALDSALDNYMKGNYEKAIRRADLALHIGTPTAEDRARAAIIKAQSLDQLGDTTAAVGLYQYIVETFPDDPESYQARERLRHLQRAGEASP